MANLTSLNRTLIPANDAEVAQTGVRLITRKGAEIDFMNRKANQWFDLNQSEMDKFHNDYPRNDFQYIFLKMVTLRKMGTEP